VENKQNSNTCKWTFSSIPCSKSRISGWGEGEERMKRKMSETVPVNVFCESPWGYITGTQQ